MRPRILIVEDDLATREALRRILELEGCDLDLVGDGEKAVGALAQRRYDAIILDIALPKMSGTDVMEYIASTTPAVLTSIVVVTGLDADEVRKLFPEICETLSKPVMPGRLIASVRRCLTPGGESSGLSGISVA
ncbi:MAG TPA: response regulator [Thermoanaerobaculia bacterium]|jgi:DNA-binding response OmpR family regulator|nr:response regulator [Thermoanaerobaculia bacterium]